MNRPSKTEQCVTKILEGMHKAMPEILRQIEVYEKSLHTSNQIKSPKVTVQLRNGT